MAKANELQRRYKEKIRNGCTRMVTDAGRQRRTFPLPGRDFRVRIDLAKSTRQAAIRACRPSSSSPRSECRVRSIECVRCRPIVIFEDGTLQIPLVPRRHSGSVSVRACHDVELRANRLVSRQPLVRRLGQETPRPCRVRRVERAKRP